MEDQLPHSKLPSWAQPLLCGVALGVTVQQFSHKLPRFLSSATSGAHGLLQTFEQAFTANNAKISDALSKDEEEAQKAEDSVLSVKSILKHHTGQRDIGRASRASGQDKLASLSKRKGAPDPAAILDVSDPEDGEPDDTEIEDLRRRLREAEAQRKTKRQRANPDPCDGSAVASQEAHCATLATSRTLTCSVGNSPRSSTALTDRRWAGSLERKSACASPPLPRAAAAPACPPTQTLPCPSSASITTPHPDKASPEEPPPEPARNSTPEEEDYGSTPIPAKGFDASRLEDRLYYLNAKISLWWPLSRCGPGEEPGYYQAIVGDAAEDPSDAGVLKHFLTFADQSQCWVRLDTMDFQSLKREEWLTSGHAFVGKMLALVVKRVKHISPVIAWLPADEQENDPVLFKVELEPNDFQDLELHEVEEAFRRLEQIESRREPVPPEPTAEAEEQHQHPRSHPAASAVNASGL